MANLTGTAGNDSLSGGFGNDDYVFGPAPGKDSIANFSFTGVDVDQLDVSDLLVGFIAGVSNAFDFVQIAVGGGTTTIRIDANGLVGGSSFTDLAVIAAGPPDGTTIDQIIANNIILT